MNSRAGKEPPQLSQGDLAAASLVEAIDGPRLAIPVELVRRLGGDLHAAAFLSQAAFLTALTMRRRPDRQGWFDLRKEGEGEVAGTHKAAAGVRP